MGAGTAERREGLEQGEQESYVVYDLFLWFFNIIFHVFFRTIRVRGAWRIPRDGPVIFVGAPHANQFVDPILLGIQAFRMAGRRACFLIAEKSYKHPIIGFLARMMKAIPVGRAQDSFAPATGEVYADGKDSTVLHGRNTKFLKEAAPGRNISFHGFNDLAPIAEVRSDVELVLAKPFKTAECRAMMEHGFAGLEFKIGEKIDNTAMFHQVFRHLKAGGALGIFPEGGSHDRTTLLPLKPGVAIMALGVAAEAQSPPVAVVPVGMNYFHPHKFRSRAVVEFGAPLYVDPKLAHDYAFGGPAGKQRSVTQFMSQIADALQLVTINCPDYETLLVVQAGQRLYKPSRKEIPLSLTIEFTRRFVQGYLEFKEKDPRIRELFEAVRSYNNALVSLGVSDHQVSRAQVQKRKIFARLIFRVLLLLALTLASLPGLVLGCPVLLFTKLYSNRKARLALAASSVKIQGHDVIATWKILCSLLVVPSLFGFYAIMLTYRLHPGSLLRAIMLFLVLFWALHLLAYATIITGEMGLGIFFSLKPLYLALSPRHKDALKQLRERREELRGQVTAIVNELGPVLFPDLERRLDSDDEPEIHKDVSADPRIDIRGLPSSINMRGDYDLAKVSVFSTESAPAVLRRRKRQ